MFLKSGTPRISSFIHSFIHPINIYWLPITHQTLFPCPGNTAVSKTAKSFPSWSLRIRREGDSINKCIKVGLWLSFRFNSKKLGYQASLIFPWIPWQIGVPCPMEDMKENVGEAERIKYCRKIFQAWWELLPRDALWAQGTSFPKIWLAWEIQRARREVKVLWGN